MARHWKHLAKPELGALNEFSSFIASEEWKDPDLFADIHQTNDLVVSFDSSGSHPLSQYEAFSYLFLSVSDLPTWSVRKNILRQNLPIAERRMSYKSLGDRKRSASLGEFLDLADTLRGSLVVLAAHRKLLRSFGIDDAEVNSNDELSLQTWSPRTRRRLLALAHFSALVTSCLTHEGQSLFWIYDEDEIFANEKMHIQATKVFTSITNHYLSHQLGRVRIATTKNDTGNFDLEDLCAIPDLSAGASCNFLNTHGIPLVSNKVLAPLALRIALKANALIPWLFSEQSLLRKSLFVWNVSPENQKQFARIRLFTDRESAAPL